MTGANRHDVPRVEAVLDALVVERTNPPLRRNKHLCANAGHIPHIKGRGQAARELKRDPEKKAKRWIIAVAHSGFNRFLKLLVRYEKLDRTFLAINHWAASISAFRKIKLSINIICG